MVTHANPGNISLLLALAPAALLICLTTLRGIALLAADWALRRRP